MPKTVCFISGSRADYGLLYWTIKDLLLRAEYRLKLVVTGMHLAPEFGATKSAIEADGIIVDEEVDILMAGDGPVSISKSVGLGVISFAEVFSRLKPDLVILLGDRFEIFAAAQAAYLAKIPIGHIGGGDVTEGSLDDGMRHSISKMSHIHFVTNEISAKRLHFMGEDPKYIFNVGSPGLDWFRRQHSMTKEELEVDLNFTFREKNIIVTFHPVTISSESSISQFKELLKAINRLGPEIGVIFTYPNADSEGRSLVKCLTKFSENKENIRIFESLGQVRYLSVMKNVDAIVGNSSSGIYEAPTLGIPTVNIGQRQEGRIMASSIINCPPNSEAIFDAIRLALDTKCVEVINPYDQGDCSGKIISALDSVCELKSLVYKKYCL